MMLISIRSYLKNVFWSNLGVGPSLQVLEILKYVCGLKLGPALILVRLRRIKTKILFLRWLLIAIPLFKRECFIRIFRPCSNQFTVIDENMG